MKKEIIPTFILLFISIIVILDLIIPGQQHLEEIKGIQKEKEQYYNAAQNFHFSYSVLTEKNAFSVSKKFALNAKPNDQIEYQTSLIFNEVNGFKLINQKETSFSTIRILSGFIVPFIFIISSLTQWFFKKKYEILNFVLQIITIGNLIYLMQ